MQFNDNTFVRTYVNIWSVYVISREWLVATIVVVTIMNETILLIDSANAVRYFYKDTFTP